MGRLTTWPGQLSPADLKISAMRYSTYLGDDCTPLCSLFTHTYWVLATDGQALAKGVPACGLHRPEPGSHDRPTGKLTRTWPFQVVKIL